MASQAAIQILQQQNPYVDQATIQNIYQNECNGDVNKAIPILMKINEFNKSMNQSPAQQIPLKATSPQTQPQEGVSTAVQPVIIQSAQPAQQQVVTVIPVQPMNVVANNDYLNRIRERYPKWKLNLDPLPGCHSCCDAVNCQCCVECCPACYMVPDQYLNGLYDIDLKIKNVSFMIFVAMTIYSEFTMVILESAYYGFYLPGIGLICMGLASVLFFASKERNDSSINKLIAILYVIGGLLYFAGYFIYASVLEDYNVCNEGGTVCDCEYYYYYYNGISYDQCWCDSKPDYGRDQCTGKYSSYHGYTDTMYNYTIYAPYYVFRGLFILYHCIIMGLHYISPTVACGCCKNRLTFIQGDTTMFALYLGVVLSLSIPDLIWTFAFSGCFHIFAGIAAFINMCIATPITNKGGINAFTVNGIFLMMFYIAEILLLLSFSLDVAIHDHDDIIITPNIVGMPWFFWTFGVAVFGTFQYWILLRMMHPVFVCCLCARVQRDVLVTI